MAHNVKPSMVRYPDHACEQGADLPMMTKITETLSARTGSHILYFYSDGEAYLDNAVSYIQMGLKFGHHVVFVDSEERFERVQERLDGGEQMDHLHYLRDVDHYCGYEFDFEKAIAGLDNIMEPFMEANATVRTWGHIRWADVDGIDERLKSFENQCDLSISGLGYTTVCAYDGHSVPAYVEIEMMRHHEYLMTDESLTTSNLYKEFCNRPVRFPSLFAHDELVSHEDLNSQKLEFLHVVSHEVRNPLAVVEGYAAQLSEVECDETKKSKLEGIRSHVAVLDYELANLILTEEMLSTDIAWMKKLVEVLPVLMEVQDVYKRKANNQNMRLICDFRLGKNEVVFANHEGLRIILSNLLNNAIQYGTERQDIQLTVETICNRVAISVKDNGIGMAQEPLSRMSKWLCGSGGRPTTRGVGLGIGLFMVKKLVSHFKGEVRVHSVLNFGSTFHVEIPTARLLGSPSFATTGSLA